VGTKTEKQASGKGIKIAVQSFGRFLSGMVLPNIGAFIAWGLITALFIETGWLPNADLATLVGPMITYLLPLLIAYTGGNMIHGARGGVLGTVATIGVIVGTDVPMFLGAMIVGPLAAWIMKKFDQMVEGKIRAGFEMLVNNFSAGIIGGGLALLSYKIFGPIAAGISKVLGEGVGFLIDHSLLPLASIIIEPAKVLFLNNAINHGVLGPLALEQASSAGKSIIFMLESNPGPGLGILLAYMLVGRGMARQSAPGAAIIHFLGGIHEIYFPYILMNPRLILAAITGGMAGVFTSLAFGAGLVAAPSPGSIFAYILMAPKGGLFPVLASVTVAAAVSFLVGSLLLKTSKKIEEDLDKAKESVQQMKNEAKGIAQVGASAVVKDKSEVAKVVFACDAGMGSSAMGASILRKKFKTEGIGVTVVNTAISDIPGDADIIITHKTLTARAFQKAPNAEHISIDDFLKSPAYDELVQRLS
jgi:PTS system mannitol-specific IIC component